MHGPRCCDASVAADNHASGGTPLWLLSSSLTETNKLGIDGDPADFTAMNYAELTKRNGAPPLSVSEVLKAAGETTTENGGCLVTLGKHGSLLVSPGKSLVYHQPASAITLGSTTLGAGDVLAGCILAARLAGASWELALRDSTARTASYLRGRVPHVARPYQLLLSGSVETPVGKACVDDQSLGFLASIDIG